MSVERFESSGQIRRFISNFTKTPILDQAARDTGVSFGIERYPGQNRYFPSGGYSTLGFNDAEV